jgi:hypothetical protein
MTSVAAILKEVQQGISAGPVSRAMAKWDKKITVEAVEKINALRLKDLDNDRASGEGRFRGSLLGSCPRMQMLSYRGYLAKPPEGDGLEIMRDGTYRHYFWQEVGLSAGFLSDVEVFVEHEPWHFGGQLDGVMMPDDQLSGRGGFELKTMNERSFSNAIKQGSVSEKHLKQIGAYCEAGGFDWFSVVYETRSFTVKWKEFVVKYDDALKELISTSVESLLDYEAREVLPPYKENYPKDYECSLWCQYKTICPSATF